MSGHRDIDSARTISALWLSGMTAAEIGVEIGMETRCVENLIQRYRRTGYEDLFPPRNRPHRDASRYDVAEVSRMWIDGATREDIAAYMSISLSTFKNVMTELRSIHGYEMFPARRPGRILAGDEKYDAPQRPWTMPAPDPSKGHGGAWSRTISVTRLRRKISEDGHNVQRGLSRHLRCGDGAVSHALHSVLDDDTGASRNRGTFDRIAALYGYVPMSGCTGMYVALPLSQSEAA